jgi:hypothetical protein
VYHKISGRSKRLAVASSCSKIAASLIAARLICQPFATWNCPPKVSRPAPPQLGAGIDRTGWAVIAPDSYWGKRFTNFMLQHDLHRAGRLARRRPGRALPAPGRSPATSATRRRWPTSTARPTPPATATTRRSASPAVWCDGPGASTRPARLERSLRRRRDPSASALYMRTCQVVLRSTSPRATFWSRRGWRWRRPRASTTTTPPKAHLLNALDAAFKVLDTRAAGRDESRRLIVLPATAFAAAFYASVPAAHLR